MKVQNIFPTYDDTHHPQPKKLYFFLNLQLLKQILNKTWNFRMTVYWHHLVTPTHTKEEIQCDVRATSWLHLATPIIDYDNKLYISNTGL